MAKFNLSEPDSAYEAADRILQHIRGVMTACDSELKQIRSAVKAGGGKAKVVAALGGRATDVQDCYTQVKTLVSDWCELTPEDL